jgi:hypothetical protein
MAMDRLHHADAGEEDGAAVLRRLGDAMRRGLHLRHQVFGLWNRACEIGDGIPQGSEFGSVFEGDRFIKAEMPAHAAEIGFLARIANRMRSAADYPKDGIENRKHCGYGHGQRENNAAHFVHGEFIAEIAPFSRCDRKRPYPHNPQASRLAPAHRPREIFRAQPVHGRNKQWIDWSSFSW